MIKKTLYFGHPVRLSLRNGQLVIRPPHIRKKDLFDTLIDDELTRPIEDIGVLILDNREITVTQRVFAALLECGCAVITCNEKSMPAGLLLPLEGNTIQSERFQAQIKASLPLRKQLWQQTIQAKIHNQASVLATASKTEVSCMRAWERQVRSGDVGGMEARAAAYYWKNLFAKSPNFTRSRDGEQPNAMLNYGYAILRAVVARALVASGLLPTLGIHHHNRYNAYCLADDVMEPYRPYVDEIVVELLKRHTPSVELTLAMKADLLTIPTLDVSIDGRRSPLMVAASQTTASLAQCFLGEQHRISYPQR